MVGRLQVQVLTYRFLVKGRNNLINFLIKYWITLKTNIKHCLTLK